MSVLNTAWDGLSNALLMAWTVWWALVFGFAISAIVQAWVPRERIERALGGGGARPVALARGSEQPPPPAPTRPSRSPSRCSPRAPRQPARSPSSSPPPTSSSSSGAVIWILIGWQFALAELVGGLLLIAIMALLLRAFVSRRTEEEAREHARAADAGHQHHSAGARMPIRARLTSAAAWSDVAHNFRNDWAMLYREIAIGFLLAGFIGLLGNDFFNGLFIVHAPAPLRLAENVLVGPLIAMLSFVCSVGNIPLAAVLWSGGIGFAGVIAFIFADLIVLPIVAIYRKYYGTAFALRIVALMLVTMVLAALAVDGLFSATGLIPDARPTRADIFGSVKVDYKLFTNVLGTAIFIALFALTVRRGATDPVCGMKVDRRHAISVRHGGHTDYFCPQHCAEAFAAQETSEERPDGSSLERAR